ncbi:LysR family transcriptional regulator [Marinobacterium arenosum]|uniref:LysR family transcriptional regulator n=1 Tax=Marinobacterium arenosum TaxID=2862496 RepID=UPI001C954639|nr:LysR family transcriptional regulator [Marinobacterium arenosum]MBY4675713.1 LysR family transcriptional regulator [Marinobacterium arenosum]
MLLEGLETLYVLAQEGTMGKAGSRLYISQSAVSKRIANLEARLGKKLIEPQGRNIQLTAEARELLTSAAPELVTLKGLLFDHQELTDETRLQIACSETVLAAYLGDFLRDYLQRDSGLDFVTHHTPLILEKVRAGDAALGICAGRLPAVTDLQVDRLLEEPFVLVYPEPLSFDRPLQVLTIDLHNPANRYLEPQLLQTGLQPGMQMNSFFAVAQLGVKGVAPALVPQGLIATMGIADRMVQPTPQPLSRPLNLCYRPRSLQRERIGELRQRLVEHFAALGDGD